MTVQSRITESQILIFPESSQSFAGSMQASWFDSDYWQQQQAIIGESKGRYTTWFIKPPKQACVKGEGAWVLRHYYRGGLIAKLTHDQFIYTGLNNTRCFAEVGLLQLMQEKELPVPKAIGGRIIRSGLFYRADLLMEKIEAKDLVALLKESGLSGEQWANIGKTIANFHRHGIDHTDLNAHNILIDPSDKVWLIDFDRCQQRLIKSKWQQQNIARLRRSFLKEKSLCSGWNFDENSWAYLMDGYKSAI